LDGPFNMTIEVEQDRMTLYEGETEEPLYRRGQTILRSDISEIRDAFALSVFGLLQRD
jgi:hypothetical protein